MTFLDLLVTVFIGLAILGLFAIGLMFLGKSHKLQQVCLYLVAALGIYACFVGVRIGFPFYPMQYMSAILAGAMGVFAVILERLSKKDEKNFKIARFVAVASFVIGMIAAFT